jgi:hypothetical protein
MITREHRRSYPRHSRRGTWGIVLLTFSTLLAALATPVPVMAVGPGGSSCTGRCDYDYFLACVDCRFTILRGFACWSPDCAHCYELDCPVASAQPPAWLEPTVQTEQASPEHAARVRLLPART